jgi:hypothetical protein
MGASWLDYGGVANADVGWTYSLSANWRILRQLQWSVLGSSYYQPSERQYASQTRVDAVSWGIAKVMVRGKLRATFDIRYRHEAHESITDSNWDYNLDVWTGRLGLDYTICRFLSVFANVEYQKSMNDEAEKRNGAYDYDRLRATIGLKLQY